MREPVAIRERDDPAPGEAPAIEVRYQPERDPDDALAGLGRAALEAGGDGDAVVRRGRARQLGGRVGVVEPARERLAVDAADAPVGPGVRVDADAGLGRRQQCAARRGPPGGRRASAGSARPSPRRGRCSRSADASVAAWRSAAARCSRSRAAWRSSATPGRNTAAAAPTTTTSTTAPIDDRLPRHRRHHRVARRRPQPEPSSQHLKTPKPIRRLPAHRAEASVGSRQRGVAGTRVQPPSWLGSSTSNCTSRPYRSPA